MERHIYYNKSVIIMTQNKLKDALHWLIGDIKDIINKGYVKNPKEAKIHQIYA